MKAIAIFIFLISLCSCSNISKSNQIGRAINYTQTGDIIYLDNTNQTENSVKLKPITGVVSNSQFVGLKYHIFAKFIPNPNPDSKNSKDYLLDNLYWGDRINRWTKNWFGKKHKSLTFYNNKQLSSQLYYSTEDNKIYLYEKDHFVVVGDVYMDPDSNGKYDTPALMIFNSPLVINEAASTFFINIGNK